MATAPAKEMVPVERVSVLLYWLMWNGTPVKAVVNALDGLEPRLGPLKDLADKLADGLVE